MLIVSFYPFTFQYVAITGCPNAQRDHALRMAKFANQCVTKLNQTLHRLTAKLGEDTLRLKVRVGLHSGPVTAGVLRGERARFQLFGDTVNVAAVSTTQCFSYCAEAAKLMSLFFLLVLSHSAWKARANRTVSKFPKPRRTFFAPRA